LKFDKNRSAISSFATNFPQITTGGLFNPIEDLNYLEDQENVLTRFDGYLNDYYKKLTK
jgi:hypothetical protein